MTRAPGPIPTARRSRPVARATKRANAQLTRLLDREGRGVLHMLWRILRSESDVMDAFQETFCNLAAHRNLSVVGNLRAYFYRTASNVAVEMIRSRRRQTRHLAWLAGEQSRRDPVDGSDEPIANPEHAARIRSAMAELPPHLREVIVLRDMARMSYEEVGRLLDVTPGTARVYRRHAVVRLADLLGEMETDL